MAEEYIESYLIRGDNWETVESPTILDDDCDSIFEFEGTVQLKHILKSVQNQTHNRNDYVFNIVSITKLDKEV